MKVEAARCHDRIMQDPAIMVGKPVVKGTRIPVERVIEHLAHNPDFEDLFSAYPELTTEDVKACLQLDQFLVVTRRSVRVRRSSQP